MIVIALVYKYFTWKYTISTQIILIISIINILWLLFTSRVKLFIKSHLWRKKSICTHIDCSISCVIHMKQISSFSVYGFSITQTTTKELYYYVLQVVFVGSILTTFRTREMHYFGCSTFTRSTHVTCVSVKRPTHFKDTCRLKVTSIFSWGNNP